MHIFNLKESIKTFFEYYKYNSIEEIKYFHLKIFTEHKEKLKRGENIDWKKLEIASKTVDFNQILIITLNTNVLNTTVNSYDIGIKKRLSNILCIRKWL